MKKTNLFFPAVVAGASFLTAGVASADNVFVSNNGDNSILEISSGSSSPTVFISDNANLNGPTGIAFNSAGDLLVANNGTVGAGFIAEYSSTGAFIGDIATGLFNPRGLAFDASGNLFVANQSGGSIVEIPFNGTSYGSSFTLASGFNFPNGLAYGNGGLYVANAGASTIVQLSLPSGTPSPFVSGVTNPNGLAFLGSDLLEVNTGSDQILEYNPAGTEIGVFAGSTYLNNAHGIAVDSADNVWVTNEGNQTVVEFSSTGAFLGSYAGFSGPNFITTDAVPEPSTWAMMLGGLSALLFLARRKKATL
jgi:PEP-CTERM motif/NHL repeat